MYKHVLIATDGSELSQRGLVQGFELAKVFKSEITVITVTEPFPTYDLASKMGLLQDPEVIEKYNSDSREIAEKILSDAQDYAAKLGVSCETLYIDNSAPAAAILQAAKFRACDLIVVTSHGRRGLERLVLGSQASEVLSGATVPVLVAR